MATYSCTKRLVYALANESTKMPSYVDLLTDKDMVRLYGDAAKAEINRTFGLRDIVTNIVITS